MSEQTILAANEYLTQLLGDNPVTVSELIEAWIGFVVELGGGYSLTIYDYDNDLESRILLEKVIREVSPEQGQEILAEIEKSDADFFGLTRGVRRNLGKMTEVEEKWLSRIPIELGPEMAADLDNIVLVDDGVEE